MIRVLHVGLSNNPGGVENLILNYHEYIDHSRAIFDYLDIYGEGIFASNRIEELEGKIYSLPNCKKHPIAAAKRFRDILNRGFFDIVHFHMQSAANIIPIIVALKHGSGIVICHSHSSSVPRGMLRRILNCVNIRLLRRMNVEKWACGECAGKWMWGKRFDSKNIVTNAIEGNKYKYNSRIRKDFRKKIGFCDNDKIIGFVGRFGDEKNTFFLIDVLKELLKISSHYKLITVGGNGLFDQFYEKIRSEGLDNDYYSVGVRASVYEWYQVIDALLLPSFFEGFPMVGVEAQAAGLPCFFSNCITQEIDITGNVCFLPIGKYAATIWAKEIDQKLNSSTRRCDRFPGKYMIQNAADNLLEKYETLIDNQKLGKGYV